MKLSYLLSGLILFVLPLNLMASDCPYCCKRKAILGDLNNLHAPTYEDDEQGWRECMNEQMKGESTLEPDNPTLIKALEKCKQLEPEIWSQPRWHYMRPSSLFINLQRGLGTEYFSMTGGVSVFGMPFLGEHEYIFDGSYQANINDGSIINDGSKVNGKPVESRFILELYYNGKSKELVKS